MAVKVDYAVQETFTNIRRNFFLTMAAILVVTVSLYLVGGVLLARSSLNRALVLQTNKVEVAVFLANEITPDERASIRNDLNEMPEVGGVIYETKAEAYERFKELFRDEPEIVRNTSPNALPESFRVKLKDPDEFEVVRDRLQGRPGINQIRDDRNFLKKFFSVVNAVQAAGLVLVLLLAIAATVLIATTIRMALYARRKEIGIMKLVGATNWFIRVPFMLEGIIHGMVGTILAAGLLLATRPVFLKVAKSLQFLGINTNPGDVLRTSFFLLAIGIFMGALGSLFGLRRFLDV
jgi:cell division transport system permease protein